LLIGDVENEFFFVLDLYFIAGVVHRGEFPDVLAAGSQLFHPAQFFEYFGNQGVLGVCFEVLEGDDSCLLWFGPVFGDDAVGENEELGWIAALKFPMSQQVGNNLAEELVPDIYALNARIVHHKPVGQVFLYKVH